MLLTKFVEFSVNTQQDLKDTEDACTKLVVSMGEKLTDKYTLQDFWATLREIFDWWKEADVNLKKIDAAKEKEREKKEKAAKKKKKAAERKARLEKKMKRRPSKDDLAAKGVYKSANKVRQEKKERDDKADLVRRMIAHQREQELQLVGRGGHANGGRGVRYVRFQGECVKINQNLLQS